jgi:phage anti-repressor protein
MFEIIKIEKRVIGNEERGTVNARDLWEALEVKRRYGNWVKEKLSIFTEGSDYVASEVFNQKVKNPLGGRPTKDFFLTIDTAKHIALMSRTEKGMKVRNYFIEVEKRARKLYQNAKKMLPIEAAEKSMTSAMKIANLLKVPEHYAQIEAVKMTREHTGVDVSNMLTHAPAQDNIQDDEVMLEPTELGKYFGFSAIKMNKLLAFAGLQVKTARGWEPTEKGKSFCAKHAWSSGEKSGYNFKWNLKKVKNFIMKGTK